MAGQDTAAGGRPGPAGPTRLSSGAVAALVFVSGAAVLVVEVAALRVLSPYFGNTLFSTSSVLSVVLGALALGYWAGGRLADRLPAYTTFFALFLLGGASVLLLQVLRLMILPLLGAVLPVTTGPIVASVLMFLLPGLLLGMLSPFAIALLAAQAPERGAASIAGSVYFSSTAGSIVGSLAAGFVLVPFVGLDRTLIGTGVVLLAIGFVALAAAGRVARRLRKVAAISVVLAVVGSLPIGRDDRVIYSRDGVYEQLTVYDGTRDGRPTRFLLQDRSLSSAMYLDGDDLVFDYSKYYALYRALTPDATRSLVLGGAGYSIPKALLADPRMHVDVVEVEPVTYELAQRYFGLPESDRLRNHIADGRRFLTASDQRYDVVFSDVYYSLFSIPPHFTTREFFDLARSRLAPDGIFVANLIGSLEGEGSAFLRSEIATFTSVFDNHYVFATRSPAGSAEQNVVLVGVNGPARLDAAQPGCTGGASEILCTWPDHEVRVTPDMLRDVAVLTDDRVPTEYLTARSLANAGV